MHYANFVHTSVCAHVCIYSYMHIVATWQSKEVFTAQQLTLYKVVYE